MYRFLQTIFKDLEINYQPLDKENLSRSKEKNGKLICLNSGWLTTQNWTIKYVNLQLENYIGMYFFTSFPTIECSLQEKHTIKKTKLVKKVALSYHDQISPLPSILLPNTCCTKKLK
jgi:hypothetical protein